MDRRAFLAGASSALLTGALAACDSSKDPKLVGTREDVLPETQLLRPSGPPIRVLLPPPQVTRDWPQAGGYPPHAMLHLALPNNPRQAWNTRIGKAANTRSAILNRPIVFNGVIYVADAVGVISAWRQADGRQLWKLDPAPKDTEPGTYGGGLAYDDGGLYATTGYNELLRLNPADGAVVWRKPLPAPARGGATVRAGRVLVVTADNTTTVLAATDGHLLWTHSGTSEPASFLGGTSPAVDGNTVIVTYSSGEIFALRIENGSIIWTDAIASNSSGNQISNLPDIRGLPVVSGNRVFAVGNSGPLVAFDEGNGTRLWEADTGSIETPWVAGDFLFVLTGTPAVVCLQVSTGKVVWSTRLPGFKNPDYPFNPLVWSGPVLASNRLIITASSGEVLAMSPYNGRALGRINLPAALQMAPVIADRSLIFLSNDARLFVYR